MSKFLVSARKYRPQTFTELVSQRHVGETLRNAIRLDRLAHAYLFCGPRGVGKTSAARILAKTVNCLTPPEERENLEPCRKCESCRSFEEGRSLNVIEIDAASNNSVEDVRALRETVRVPPQIGLKKVYIIDEVHMLSKSAFNALLKTLEEPPPYVQFLFATTEPQKVLPTILSRCQRFDFRRISIPDMVQKLKEICEAEGIQADDASLRLIARKGDGALRDAFSTFDQAVLLCGQNIEYQALVEALGTVDIDVYFETADLIAAGDRAGLLLLVERLVAKGNDINEFLVGLTDHVRNLLVALTTGSTDLIESDTETSDRYAQQAAGFDENDLLRYLIVAEEAQNALRRSIKPRLRLELALLKMASLAHSADLKRIIEGLDGSVSVQSESSSAKDIARTTTPATPAPAASVPTESARPEPDSPVQSPVEPAPVQTRPVENNVETPEARSGPVGPVPLSAAPKVSEPSSTERKASDLFGRPAINLVTTARNRSESKSAADEATSEQESGSNRTGGVSEGVVPFATIETAWEGYVAAVMQDRIHVGALLQHANPVSIVGETVEIAVPDDFHSRLLGSESDYLASKLGTTLSLDPAPSVRVVISDDVPEVEATPELDPAQRIQELKEKNPVIAALIEKFGGEVVW